MTRLRSAISGEGPPRAMVSCVTAVFRASNAAPFHLTNLSAFSSPILHVLDLKSMAGRAADAGDRGEASAC